MPLESLHLNGAVKAKLRRKIRWLINTEILHTRAGSAASYDLGFCMHIQVVPKKQFNSFEFGRPEGIRAFIQSGDNVIGAADFLFNRKILKLSYVHQGHGLNVLLEMLNKLEKKYARMRSNCHAELIYFLLAPAPYLLVKSGKKKQFYHSKKGRLLPVSSAGLKKEINGILVQR